MYNFDFLTDTTFHKTFFVTLLPHSFRTNDVNRAGKNQLLVFLEMNIYSIIPAQKAYPT